MIREAMASPIEIPRADKYGYSFTLIKKKRQVSNYTCRVKESQERIGSLACQVSKARQKSMAWHSIAQHSRAQGQGTGIQDYQVYRIVSREANLLRDLQIYSKQISALVFFFYKKQLSELTCSEFYNKKKSFSPLLLFLYMLVRHENHQNKINAFKRWARTKGQGKGKDELLLFLQKNSLPFFPLMLNLGEQEIILEEPNSIK